jgi:hypothetical protein
MIDKSNEIFTLIANKLRSEFEGIKVIGENIDIPKSFPTATIDEVSNLPVHKDTKMLNEYADVRYQVQVFTSGSGKRSDARKIYAVIDELLQELNFQCKMFSTRPEIYDSQVYQITSSYEAVISEDGVIFRKN